MKNFKEFLNKKNVFIFGFVLILIFGGLFFWWWQLRETPLKKWDIAEISRPEEYIIKGEFEEKIVENEKLGLVYKVPKDWIVKKENPASLYSSDAEFSEIRSDVLEKGCRIEVLASKIKTNLNILEKYLDENFLEWSPVIEVDDFQKIELSNHLALKHKYHVRQDSPDRIKMAFISVHVPSERYLYKILLAASLRERERCEKEFDSFLETVSIK